MKVSIITVCLNSEKYIEQTIQSVLNQTYKNIEYIIIDGLSTDNTLKIIDKYKPMFGENLKLISEKDNGIYDAMNKGIKKATGELIGIINSDDWYEIETLKEVVSVSKKTPQAVIYGVVPFWNNNSITNITITSYKEPYNRPIPHPSVFIPTKVYKEYGLYDINYQMLADQDLLIRLCEKKVPFKFIPKVLANFRLGGTSDKFKDICENERKIILQKYNLYNEIQIDPLENYEIDYLWAKLYEKVKNYSNVYIYGTGKHTEMLLNSMPQKIRKNIRGLIDQKNISNKLYNYNIYDIKNIINSADAILISSLTYEDDIFNRINNFKNNVDIIRIYGANTIEEVNNIVKDAVIL